MHTDITGHKSVNMIRITLTLPNARIHIYKTRELRHPIVERIRQDVKFVTNDLEFGLPEQSGILLFGLNSSGKSTTMKAVGCALIMAQAGMFVPAKSFRILAV